MPPYGYHQRPPTYDFITPSRRTLPPLPRFRALLWDGTATRFGGSRAGNAVFAGFREGVLEIYGMAVDTQTSHAFVFRLYQVEGYGIIMLLSAVKGGVCTK